MNIGNRHPDIPANLFLCFVDASDHAELQTAAGRGIGTPQRGLRLIFSDRGPAFLRFIPFSPLSEL